MVAKQVGFELFILGLNLKHKIRSELADKWRTASPYLQEAI